MESSLQKLVKLAVGTKVEGTIRHRTVTTAPICEMLETRQLLSTASPSQTDVTATTLPADVSTTAMAPTTPPDGGVVPGNWQGWDGGPQDRMAATSNLVATSFVPQQSGIFGWLYSGDKSSTDPSNPTSDPGNSSSSSGDSTQAAFDKLQTDMQAINDKSEVTPAALAAVRKDVQKLQDAATSAPDTDKVNTLINDINALKGQLPTADQATQLKSDFTAVLNSAGITDQDLINQTITDLETIVTDSNVTNDDLTTIAADHAAIQTALGNPVDGSDSSTSTSSDEATLDPSNNPFSLIFGPETGMSMGGFGFGGVPMMAQAMPFGADSGGPTDQASLFRGGPDGSGGPGGTVDPSSILANASGAPTTHPTTATPVLTTSSTTATPIPTNAPTFSTTSAPIPTNGQFNSTPSTVTPGQASVATTVKATHRGLSTTGAGLSGIQGLNNFVLNGRMGSRATGGQVGVSAAGHSTNAGGQTRSFSLPRMGLGSNRSTTITPGASTLRGVGNSQFGQRGSRGGN